MSIGFSFPPEDFNDDPPNLSSPDVLSVQSGDVMGLAVGSCAFAGRSVNPWHELAKCSTFFPRKYRGNSGKVKKSENFPCMPGSVGYRRVVASEQRNPTQPKS